MTSSKEGAFMKKLTFENRIGLAVILAVISIALSVIFGLLFSFLAFICGDMVNSFIWTFWNMAKGALMIFFAPGIVSSLLLALTKMDDDLVFWFGCGLYYGSLFAISICQKIGDETLPYIAGILLTIIVGHVVYKSLSQ